MGKENRLDQEEGEEDKDEAAVGNKGEKDQDEEDEGNQEPVRDDCFEYKLVGVNVHSGTAHAGHYWSYINTRRGREEADEEADGQVWS
jgi:uncharacterized UBP type Zn finger protein